MTLPHRRCTSIIVPLRRINPVSLVSYLFREYLAIPRCPDIVYHIPLHNLPINKKKGTYDAM
jgi:hypothetical protein